MEEIITVLGLVLVLEGLPYFAFPAAFKSWIARVLEMPESKLRAYGFASMLAGLFLIYLARRSGLI